MKILHNAGTERVIDLVRPWLAEGNKLDVVSSSLSLFAFAELIGDATKLAKVRLLLPSDPTDMMLIGSEVDRAGRNRLQARWLARTLSQWLADKAEIRRAPGLIPQGAMVLRSSRDQPEQAILGSFSFSSSGLGITPGNPLSLIQASETPEEALLLSQWFDIQWSSLKDDPGAKAGLIDVVQALFPVSAHRTV